MGITVHQISLLILLKHKIFINIFFSHPWVLFFGICNKKNVLLELKVVSIDPNNNTIMIYLWVCLRHYNSCCTAQLWDIIRAAVLWYRRSHCSLLATFTCLARKIREEASPDLWLPPPTKLQDQENQNDDFPLVRCIFFQSFCQLSIIQES